MPTITAMRPDVEEKDARYAQGSEPQEFRQKPSVESSDLQYSSFPPNETIQQLRYVPELHDVRSGRLDAKNIAECFKLSLTEVARLVGRDVSSVSKTPDASALQEGLAVFEQIAAPLLYLVKTPAHLRMWMNAPNRELEGDTPLAVLRAGEGKAVAKLLDDLVVGQPG